MNQNDDEETKYYQLQGDDLFWFINGIIFVQSCHMLLNMELKDWHIMLGGKAAFPENFFEALMDGMEKVKSLPVPIRVKLVTSFMELASGNNAQSFEFNSIFDA